MMSKEQERHYQNDRFTALSEGKEAKEYNRQYVDEATERNDVVGYATSVEYEFDRYTNDKVCEKICTITDDELVGTEAQVDIVTVDVFTADDKSVRLREAHMERYSRYFRGWYGCVDLQRKFCCSV